MENYTHSFAGLLSGISYIENADMSRYTSFRTGGSARLMAMPKSPAQCHACMRAGQATGLPVFVMGNGTNLLVSDDGFDGIIIRIQDGMDGFAIDGTSVKANAGALISTVAKATVDAGLMGLEWACGIPGTVGGATAMNAGAYGGELKSVLARVDYIENGLLMCARPKESDMGYRRSAFSAPERLVTAIELALMPDDGGARQRADGYALARRTKQPLSYPSAGSTFKRPEGHFAGALIEKAGLKGLRVGGASVSTLHAGFIINDGAASSSDVYGLIKLVQKRVYEDSGVRLEPEVRLVGGFE